ncbi:MAG: polysaccharide biosynthesis protein, partial [Oscillospiraceae bacterium]
PASTIKDLAIAVQRLFGDTGMQFIGTRHGEKLYETLLTREEKIRSEDLGGYYRVHADARDLNYDKYFVKGQVQTQADEAYTSHNTKRLTVDGVVEKLMELEYIKEELAAFGK